MSYIATIKEHTYQVDIGEEGQQRSITVGEMLYALDWRALAPLAADAKGVVSIGGRYSLLIAGKSYDIFARRITRPDQQEGESYEILVMGQRIEVKIEDERTRLLAGLVKTANVGGEATLHAPMPGLVVGIPLEQGTPVEQGQTVVVLEAMKMENDLAAPISGTIKEIRVSKGQTVDQGEVLVIVAAEE